MSNPPKVKSIKQLRNQVEAQSHKIAKMKDPDNHGTLADKWWNVEDEYAKKEFGDDWEGTHYGSFSIEQLNQILEIGKEFIAKKGRQYNWDGTLK